MNTATEERPTEVADPEPKLAAETAPKPSNEADSQDARSKSRDPEKARAILRGEKPKEEAGAKPVASGAESETDAEVIARMFDPETGEFNEQEEEQPEVESKPAGTAAETKPKAAKPDTTTEEADPGEEEQSEKPGDETEDKKPEPRKRISVRRERLGDRDFAIVQLADRENISLEEARGRLFGDSQEKPAAKTEEASQRPNPAQIEAKIAQLVEQRKTAAKNLDVDAATELSDQISDLKLQLRETHAAFAGEEQARVASHRDAVIASANKAVEMYPDAGVEGTELFEALDAERQAREKSDPDFFRNKSWPMTLAVDIATERGLTPVLKKTAANEEAAGKKPSAVAQTKPAPIAKKAARPAPPNPAPGTATGAEKPNQEEALRTRLKAAKATKDISAVKAVIREIDELQAKTR